jgi:hypothetical protein
VVSRCTSHTYERHSSPNIHANTARKFSLQTTSRNRPCQSALRSGPCWSSLKSPTVSHRTYHRVKMQSRCLTHHQTPAELAVGCTGLNGTAARNRMQHELLVSLCFDQKPRPARLDSPRFRARLVSTQDPMSRRDDNTKAGGWLRGSCRQPSTQSILISQALNISCPQGLKIPKF